MEEYKYFRLKYLHMQNILSKLFHNTNSTQIQI